MSNNHDETMGQMALLFVFLFFVGMIAMLFGWKPSESSSSTWYIKGIPVRIVE